ncbi:putative effector protein [Blumeria hordei DH14]|uniref:Putative effector protein n=1 Tax=Blumeria graminis f. sp. hordei (strain DH14) TaxID=546991 RepID=N1JDB0_BLUG1|nr:putative effector protein [Blumeria hordei DH14]
MVGINCVFAFLLNIPDMPNPRSRMAVVGNRPQDNYLLFHMTQGLEFPVLKTKDIFLMPYKKSRKKTLTTFYCSFTLDLSRIFQVFKGEFSRVKKIEDLDFKKRGDGYELCKNTIWEWWETKKVTEKNKIKPIGMDILVAQRICSLSQIARLGRENFLRLTGDYGCYAPYLTRHVPVIDANLRIKLKKIVWGSQAFFGKGKGPVHALVWYQGNLHVFQRRERNAGWWYLVTKIGAEDENGKVIYDFIIKNFEKVKNLLRNLQQQKLNSLRNVQERNCDLFNKIQSRICSKKRHSEYVFESLSMTTINGELGCFHDPNKSNISLRGPGL